MINTACPSTVHSGQTVLQDAPQLSVKFWGVRGSVPTLTATNQRYGGNTVCVEVLIGNQRIVFDGGTGIVNLGHHLQRQSQQQGTSSSAHIFFTHTQWDRIQGFPFFQPAFNPDNQFHIYGGTAFNGASIKHCLTDQMLKPHFSMPLQHMRASLAFNTIAERASVNIEDIQIETLKINPVTEAFGYQLTWQGYKLVYATDTPTELVNLEFLKFVDQADLLIYDGTYCDLSYLRDASTVTQLQPWEIGIEIAKKANVKELAFLHHSPLQDDNTLDQLQREVQARFAKSTIAYEDLVLCHSS